MAAASISSLFAPSLSYPKSFKHPPSSLPFCFNLVRPPSNPTRISSLRINHRSVRVSRCTFHLTMAANLEDTNAKLPIDAEPSSPSSPHTMEAPKIIIEGDSFSAIHWSLCNRSYPWRLADLVEEVQDILSHLDAVLYFVLRKANGSADILTKEGVLRPSLSFEEATFDIKLPRRSLLVQFTCDACGERTQRTINRVAYERGTVFVQCSGCLQHHKLVDNLGLIVEYDLREETGEGENSSINQV